MQFSRIFDNLGTYTPLALLKCIEYKNLKPLVQLDSLNMTRSELCSEICDTGFSQILLL